MSAWQPIETAPPNERVDLWAHRVGEPMSGGWRFPNCSRGKGEHPFWKNHDGKWFTGRRFYDEDGDECYDPSLTDAGSIVVTHWTPLPEPPK